MAQLLKQLYSTALESMLQGELDVHLTTQKIVKAIILIVVMAVLPNISKQNLLKAKSLFIEIVVVLKHKSNSLSVENIVISLYAKGMSVADIEDELQEIYGLKLFKSSAYITSNRVHQGVLDWENRPLDNVYCVVRMGEWNCL